MKIKTGPIKDDADKSKFTDFLLENKADIENVLSTRIVKIQTHEDFLKYFLYSSIQWCQKNNAPLSHLIAASVTGSTPRIIIKSRDEVRDYIKAIFSHIFPSLRYKINNGNYTLYQTGKAKHDEIETFLDFLLLIAKEHWELCRAVTKP